MTDWNTDDSGGDGQRRYPVGKPRNSTQHYIEKKKKTHTHTGGIAFVMTSVLLE
jgi:hypothetical protein